MTWERAAFNNFTLSSEFSLKNVRFYKLQPFSKRLTWKILRWPKSARRPAWAARTGTSCSCSQRSRRPTTPHRRSWCQQGRWRWGSAWSSTRRATCSCSCWTCRRRRPAGTGSRCSCRPRRRACRCCSRRSGCRRANGSPRLGLGCSSLRRGRANRESVEIPSFSITRHVNVISRIQLLVKDFVVCVMAELIKCDSSLDNA